MIWGSAHRTVSLLPTCLFLHPVIYLYQYGLWNLYTVTQYYIMCFVAHMLWLWPWRAVQMALVSLTPVRVHTGILRASSLSPLPGSPGSPRTLPALVRKLVTSLRLPVLFTGEWD